MQLLTILFIILLIRFMNSIQFIFRRLVSLLQSNVRRNGTSFLILSLFITHLRLFCFIVGKLRL
jgi:hypothetical protein